MIPTVPFPPSPKEERLTFSSAGSPSVSLEARVFHGDSSVGVVLCHPHPLHGGTMLNKVIDTTMRGFSAQGASTLRFNFRGVGKSQGTFGDGIAEQDDILGAIQFIQQECSVQEVILVGFSFGASVASRILSKEALDGAFLIAPPLKTLPLSLFEPPMKRGARLVLGDQDEFCTPELFFQYCKDLGSNAKGELLEGVGHFFHGHLQELLRITKEIMEKP